MYLFRKIQFLERQTGLKFDIENHHLDFYVLSLSV
jgi:hypothetical protein